MRAVDGAVGPVLRAVDGAVGAFLRAVNGAVGAVLRAVDGAFGAVLRAVDGVVCVEDGVSLVSFDASTGWGSSRIHGRAGEGGKELE